MIDSQQDSTKRLQAMLAAAGLPPLSFAATAQFQTYLAVLHRWNLKINLTAIRDESEILSRHFVESIAVAHCLPTGIANLLDFGSGAGFPGLPIAICCPQIAVVLAESQVKKTAFLREVVRTIGLPVEIFTGRAETIARTFDSVVLRAVDRMGQAVTAAASLVSPAGWLILLTTQPLVDEMKALAGPAFSWNEALPLPSAEARVAVLGHKG